MKKPILVTIFLLSMVSFLILLGTTHAQTDTQVNIYAGENPNPGFGLSASTITSDPGPTLTFTSGETVTVTLHNSGSMLHNFAVVSTKSSTGAVLWNSQVASASSPVAAGGSASATFTVGAAGSYYYICQVDGHVNLGMWGVVTVNPAVPEYPAPLLFMFVAIMATALAAYVGRSKLRVKTTVF